MESIGEALIALALFFTVGGTVVLRGPLGRAIADRIAGRSGAAAGEQPNEQVIAEVDELRQRVAELEERQDFTERVLARQREQSQLDSGV